MPRDINQNQVHTYMQWDYNDATLCNAMKIIKARRISMMHLDVTTHCNQL
jgi:hypothetical protein